MSFDINQLVRENISKLQPYSSARDEYSGDAAIFLDANENPFNSPWNRYPDPRQKELKKEIASLKKISIDQLFLGNGSDEPIDLLYRAFCEPGIDNVISITPTYGMYKVAAEINNVEVKEVLLNESYDINARELLEATDRHTKMIFLCSPNNPTGNNLNKEEMIKVIERFSGLVVLDEAYIDFSPGKSLLPTISKYPNLVILQTFSKAWGMAGIRLGVAIAATPIINILNKIKYPYNINILTQQKAMEMISSTSKVKEWVSIILDQRTLMEHELTNLPFVIKVFPSDANFLLVKTNHARYIYEKLVEKKIIVRDRSKVRLCEGALRITVGSPIENQKLLIALQNITV